MTHTKESCLQLLDQLKYLSKQDKIKSSIDVITNILMIVCKTFSKKEQSICEQDINAFASKIKCKRRVYSTDKRELERIILKMRNTLCSYDTATPPKMLKSETNICDSETPSRLLESESILNSCSTVSTSKYFNYRTIFSRDFCWLRNIYKLLGELQQFKTTMCHLFSLILSSICNKSISVILKYFSKKKTVKPPWTDSLDMINELFNSQYASNMQCCFHHEASSLLLLYTRNQWSLSKSVHKGTINIGNQIGKKILKSILLCCENPDTHCDLLIKLINFLIKLDNRMREDYMHGTYQKYSDCHEKSNLGSNPCYQKCSNSHEQSTISSNPLSQDVTEITNNKDVTHKSSDSVWKLLCKLMRGWKAIKQKCKIHYQNQESKIDKTKSKINLRHSETQLKSKRCSRHKNQRTPKNKLNDSRYSKHNCKRFQNKCNHHKTISNHVMSPTADSSDNNEINSKDESDDSEEQQK